MSNSTNSSDANRNHPAKVIVLKNMPSTFKFDASKNFLSNPAAAAAAADSSTNPTSTPIINFKPQIVYSNQPHVQLIQSPADIPTTTVALQTVSSGQPKILIRAQPPQQVITNSKPSPVTTTTTLKLQDVQGTLRLVNKPPALITSKVRTEPQSSIVLSSTNPLPKVAMRIAPKLVPTSATKPIPIRPKEPVVVKPMQITQPTIQQQVLFTPGISSAYSRIGNSITYNSGPPVPALSLIQPKTVQIVSEIENVEELADDDEAPTTEEMLDIRKIIEGDQNEIAQQVAIIQSQNQLAHESSGDDEVEKHEMSQQEDSSSQSLLCDEIIDSVTPESEKNSSRAEQSVTTPVKSESVTSSVEEVKKNLCLELVKNENDKENVVINDESEPSDESKITTDFEDSLKKSENTKSEMMVEITTKSKRTRKPKNPTVNSNLGLPFKPNSYVNRRSKSEMKIEFELDFHDPINKIKWDDGIGGLDNCNKLFGFNEFGLIEILDKKDLLAKLHTQSADIKDEPVESQFKFKKITDPKDQFVCSICSKIGTVRDFFSPETCSEACMAIMKRKSQCDLSIGTRESSLESGLTTPVDERKLMFDGEMIPLPQLHQHVFEQNLPEQNKKLNRRNFNSSINITDSRFQWDTYLSAKSVPAPINLFKSPYPRGQNQFRVGMKLEAIDPFNQKLFCICTVEEKLGYRMKLHFDGYSTAYDFWVNADSQFVFPAGFCQSTNRQLQPPPKWNMKKFDWSEYLDHSNSIGANKSLFPRLNKAHENPMERGMKLEALHKGKLYVASVVDVLENRILLEFDVHPEIPCVWIDVHSPYIHPCNHHESIDNPEIFIPPVRPFKWEDYLKDTGSREAPVEFLNYQKRSPFDFHTGQKLEVVDPANPQLIRPATILCREDYKIQVIFDGFDITYAFWLDDDSEDIHPINWCEKTGHPIEHPAGFNKLVENKICKNPGCRGIGNSRSNDKYFHDIENECPYNKENWKKTMNAKLQIRTEHKVPSKKTPRKQEFTNGKRRESLMKEEFEDSSMDVPEMKEEIPVAKVTKSKRVIKKRKLSLSENGQEEVSIPQTPTIPVVPAGNRSKSLDDFMKDYGPQTNYAFHLWKKNSRVLDRASVDHDSTENPMEWSIYKVCKFVNKITNNPEIAKKFHDHDIDGSAFVCLSQNDLMELLNIKIGPAIKIYNRILHIREEINVKFIKH